MSWPSNDNRCVVLAACTLALVASCWMTACDSNDRQLGSPTAQAEQDAIEGDGDASNSSTAHAPTPQCVFDYLKSSDFQAFGVGLGDHPTDGTGLQVHLDGRSIWVYEDAAGTGGDGAAAQIEEHLHQALENRFREPPEGDGVEPHGWEAVREAFKGSICDLVQGRLVEVRACALAVHMRTAELKGTANPQHVEGETQAGPNGQATGAEAQEGEGDQYEEQPVSDDAEAKETGTSEMPQADVNRRTVHVPRTPVSACVHWVTVADGAGTTGDGPADAPVSERHDHQDADRGEEPQGTKAPSSTSGKGIAADKPGDAAESAGGPGNGSASAEGTGNASNPASPRPAGPSKLGSIDVVEAPGASDSSPTSPAPSSPATPSTPQRTWVVDVPAWDERVVTSPAWDEQVWVSKQEWVPDNVWVVDAQAWDEQVQVSEGYYETVRTTSHCRFMADDYIAYTDDEVMAHVKYLMGQGLASNYFVEWEHEDIWHEPEYSWVHHDEVGHWEDRGSYQDNGHYETVHHDARYDWVHHDEVGHWE